jgi:DNA-binding LacI/PurR family transcriptional regulator
MMHTVEDVPSVVADDHSGARQAVEYLISLGHKSIAYLTDTSAGNPLSRQRLAGYHEALRAAGIHPSRAWIAQLKNYGPMHKRGLLSMRQWLRRGFQELGCTALLVQNDLAAIGAMEALREAGIRVPEQLSVIGFDSTDECELVTPQLTSVRVPLEEIGARATELLLSQISQRQIQEKEVRLSPVIFPTRLEVRQSTAPPIHTKIKKPN